MCLTFQCVYLYVSVADLQLKAGSTTIRNGRLDTLDLVCLIHIETKGGQRSQTVSQLLRAKW